MGEQKSTSEERNSFEFGDPFVQVSQIKLPLIEGMSTFSCSQIILLPQVKALLTCVPVSPSKTCDSADLINPADSSAANFDVKKMHIRHFSNSPQSPVALLRLKLMQLGGNPKLSEHLKWCSEVKGMGNSLLNGEMCCCVLRVARNTSQTVPG